MNVNFQVLANQHVRQLVPYQPGKPIKELERELGVSSSIKLASNENPLGASPHALLAAKEALLQAHIYPDGAYYELKQELSDFLSIPQSCITVGNGSENILELIVKSYLAHGDTAVVSEYAFLTIPILVESFGALLNVAPAFFYGHDIEAMLNCIDKKTRIVFVVNPNNPTGTYNNDAQFRYLMEHVPSHILVVVDEAYHDYIDKDDYPDVQSYLTHYPNLIVTRTFSKVYGLAGLRLGYALSSPDIANILNRARLPFNVNSIAASAGIAALKDQEHVAKTVALNRLGLSMLTEGVANLGLSFIPSIANFLTINVKDAMPVYNKLLQEGVIVRPLNAYKMPEFIRITSGTEAENIRFLDALAKCIA